MSDLTSAVNATNLDRAAEVEKVHYDTVVGQIKEREENIETLRNHINSAQESIRLAREQIANHRREMAKLRKRRRIFARARFELQQVNEE